jgi:hypothetical protein
MDICDICVLFEEMIKSKKFDYEKSSINFYAGLLNCIIERELLFKENIFANFGVWFGEYVYLIKNNLPTDNHINKNKEKIFSFIFNNHSILSKTITNLNNKDFDSAFIKLTILSIDYSIKI